MNKGELVEEVYKVGEYETKAAAERAVNAVMEGIQAGLAKDEKVQLIGFGSFTVKQRKARMGRNPQTGAKIRIPASRAVSFRPGKDLKEAVAPSGGAKKKGGGKKKR